jgi:hypothetical protein
MNRRTKLSFALPAAIATFGISSALLFLILYSAFNVIPGHGDAFTIVIGSIWIGSFVVVLALARWRAIWLLLPVCLVLFGPAILLLVACSGGDCWGFGADGTVCPHELGITWHRGHIVDPSGTRTRGPCDRSAGASGDAALWGRSSGAGS